MSSGPPSPKLIPSQRLPAARLKPTFRHHRPCLAAIYTVGADSSGNVFLATESAVQRLDAKTGLLTLVAGNGTVGFSGDYGPATSAQLNFANGVAVDSAGDLYICDSSNNVIRKVSNGIITTVAGGGSGGDNGPATSAYLNLPNAVAVDSSGNLYIADTYNYRDPQSL